MPSLHAGKWPALVAVLALGVSSFTPAPARARQPDAKPEDAVVRALDQAAHPLLTTEPDHDMRDLRALGRMIGNDPVVGLGEATHGTHEFFSFKQRVFEYLVKEKGFTTFMLELSWGTGLQLNDYVLYGKGDPARIMRQEFQQNYRLFANQDYLRLIRWMRAYNERHPKRPLQFMGDDIYFPHVRIFRDIFRYVRERGRPDLVPKLKALYDGLIPTTDFNTWEARYDARPRSERLRVQRQAAEALRLVRSLRRGAPRKAAEWAEQQANVAFWIAKAHAAEDFSGPRDEAMAINTVWWLRHKHSKILLSAHNAHVGYLGESPPHTFKRQGTWLRQILGPRYLAIGASFYRGRFTAIDDKTRYLRRFTVGAPPRENGEQVLNRVRFPKYYLDMRTVKEPARSWLQKERQVRYITAVYNPTAPEDNNIVQSLGRTYSVLVELRDTTASNLIPGIPLGPQP
ncbi:erythromycin esterase family protein [Actinomadura nitritigenes]|uniref:Erythromycin esterase family protein n=1 Tax=Actinomadura nitritigenes TaxID=134602 RepID=A0ABS3QSG8_9ACTN|nr:erythromycin esterase family protein [Actinomadura nitritigenes]MBO2436933.1 erythromycin esterase family protein [Actinomadura nitritigenes]